MLDQQTLSVSQLNQKIKNKLETDFSNILVKGEISELNLHISGHMYFSIKDNSALLKCIMFNYKKSLNNYNPKIGDAIILNGSTSLYIKNGSFQFYANKIKLDGKGDLWAEFLELKNKLYNEGLFNSEFKKNIPKYPEKVAIITSLSGSVIEDIMDVINRNSPYVNIIVRDTRVQGNDAINDIIKAIHEIETSSIKIDTIIIARGGGSIEDLWCFNSEALAYKIFKCKIPIISAIGHETDTSIADFVSDQRAGTPSIAAKLVAVSVNDCNVLIDEMQNRINHIFKFKFQRYNNLLDNMKQSHGLHKINYILSTYYEKLVNIKHRINFNTLKNKVSLKKERFINLSSKIESFVFSKFDKQNDNIINISNYISAFNPKKIMKRGYSIVYDKNNKIIKSSNQVKLNDELVIQLFEDNILVKNIAKPKKKEL
jgi:exodeoxyribonuclease VII large subunit